MFTHPKVCRLPMVTLCKSTCTEHKLWSQTQGSGTSAYVNFNAERLHIHLLLCMLQQKKQSCRYRFSGCTASYHAEHAEEHAEHAEEHPEHVEGHAEAHAEEHAEEHSEHVEEHAEEHAEEHSDMLRKILMLPSLCILPPSITLGSNSLAHITFALAYNSRRQAKRNVSIIVDKVQRT